MYTCNDMHNILPYWTEIHVALNVLDSRSQCCFKSTGFPGSEHRRLNEFDETGTALRTLKIL